MFHLTQSEGAPSKTIVLMGSLLLTHPLSSWTQMKADFVVSAQSNDCQD